MQHNHGALGRLAQVVQHAVDVDAAGLLVEVAILPRRGEPGLGDDVLVVGPGGVGQIHCSLIGEELADKRHSHPKRTRAGQGLHRGDALFGNGGESFPRINSAASLVNDDSPSCGMYS